MTAVQGSLFDDPPGGTDATTAGGTAGGAGPAGREPTSAGGSPLPSDVDAATLLAPWREAGVLQASDVHVATTLARLAGLGDDDGALDPPSALVVLGAALAARAPRHGHVCLDLATVRASVPAEVEGDADASSAVAVEHLPWPTDIEGWRSALAGSALVVDLDATGDGDGRGPSGDGWAPGQGGRGTPLVLDGTRLYLERYRAYEDDVAAELCRRARAGYDAGSRGAGWRAGAGAAVGPVDAVDVEALVGLLDASPEQLAATDAGAHGLLSVIVGGPGTGKTTTVALLLVRLLAADVGTRIALVAPTGKASARMGESIAALATRLRPTPGPDPSEPVLDPSAPDPDPPQNGVGALAERLAAAEVSTVHRLLGARPDGTFRHHRGNPLAHDVVIVDETSMVSLPLMAHLLDAVRPEARLVLVGDPGQLASVEAGSVLGDIAGPAVDAALGNEPTPPGEVSNCVAVLTRSYRFPASSAVGRFAAAVRIGDADAAVAVLAAGEAEGGALDDGAGGEGAGVVLRWERAGGDTEQGAEAVRAAALDAARRTVAAARAGDAEAALAALGSQRVLCAHRRGPFGVARWNWQFEQWLADDGTSTVGSYVGRPVLVTANDPVAGLANGDLGVVVATDPSPRVAFASGTGIRLIAPARLESIETVHAMTIHKSQGSEFDEIVVVLPPADSRLATRELLYTAVTRARSAVTIVGSEAALRRAVTNRVVRQSGLRDRLWS